MELTVRLIVIDLMEEPEIETKRTAYGQYIQNYSHG